jgi:hypothetical protein
MKQLNLGIEISEQRHYSAQALDLHHHQTAGQRDVAYLASLQVRSTGWFVHVQKGN